MDWSGIFGWVVLVVVTALSYFIMAYYKRVRYSLKLPRPPSFLGVTHAHYFHKLDSGEIPNKLMELQKSVGNAPCLALWIGPELLVVLHRMPDIQKLYLMPSATKKSFAYELTKAWLGNGLLVIHGNEWFRRRKMVSKAFSIQLLMSFIQSFSEKANALADSLLMLHNEEIDIQPVISTYSLSLIAETAMSLKMDSEEERHEFTNAIHTMSCALLHRTFNVLLYPDLIFNLSQIGRLYNDRLDYIKKFVQRIIQEKRGEFKLKQKNSNGSRVIGKKGRTALLDLLIEQEEDGGLTDDELRDEINTFMFAGHDTTASCISFTLYELSRNPEIQDEVLREAENVLQDEISYSTLQKLTYLEMVLKETMRFHPTVPYMGRKLDEDFVLSDGAVLPAGSNVLVCLYNLHRDPEVFKDPHVFNPNRFSPEEEAKRLPASFIPFSTGPRSCIGQKYAMLEAKVTVATLIRKFRIKPGSEDVKHNPAMVLSSSKGIKVVFEQR